MEASVDNEVIVNAVGTVEVAVGNAANAVVADDHALDITVTKKEYKIVGDEVYIAKLYDDAPQWMKDLVQLVVDNTMETESAMLRNDLIEQLNRFATSYVPLNTYTQSILDLSNADTAMHATLETLNSNFNDGLDTANSQIINLQSTKASKTEVATKVIETLTAQLATPTSELGATIGNLQQTIVDGDSANADSVTTLMSVLEGEVDARASAIETINTYVGIDEAGASTGTGLSAYLEGSDGTIGGADSQVANGVAIVGGVPTSKWQYGSSLVVNGTTYNSGFGLSNSAGTGIGSEFWIDASRLKFTNSAKTGSTAPFTIDASGATPQITFNGKVSFSNVTDVPQLGSTPQEVVDAVNAGNTTTINGGRITTGSITANQIAANSIGANQIAAYSISADRLSSTNGNSTVWNGGGLVSSNFNGNVYGNIGTPTKGFRLSSNAAGTSADPNIYGGYIKGGAIEGAQLIGTILSVNDIKVAAVGYPNNYGPIVLIEAYGGATTNISSIFYSRGYSIGYNNKRMCSASQIFILQALTAGGTHSATVIGTTAVSINVSIDGGPWTAIASSSSYSGTASCAITYTADSTKNVQFLSTHSSKYVDSSTFSIQSINGQ